MNVAGSVARAEEVAMKRRKLGSQGLEVSALGLGCMGMTGVYGRPDEERSIQTLLRAVELGVTLFDTAEYYGPFDNEALLGRVLKPHRDRIVLATKFGVSASSNAARSFDSRPETVMASCDGSLKRLQTDYIDLYYQHRLDPDVPIEETVGALADLVAAGKVRHIGLSEADGDTIRRANAIHPVTAVQSEWSLWTRDAEAEVVPVMLELGIGFVAYSPIGRGFLTGDITSPDDLPADDWRRTNARFAASNFATNLALVDAVKDIASEKGATPGQVALAWLLHQGPNIVPIPGTTRPERLEENVVAADLALSTDDMSRLAAVFTHGAAAGARYGRA